MRYFYVTYSAEGVTGACTMTATKFINHKDFIKNLNKVEPNLRKPFITSWIEMTEEEYELFTE